jgi:hypothetical protein
LAEHLLGSRSGTGSGRFRLSDPDPVKNPLDPQHCVTDRDKNRFSDPNQKESGTFLKIRIRIQTRIRIRIQP